ncbi:MAG: MarR family transcriptional regulator [Acidimicrobiales bacterium]
MPEPTSRSVRAGRGGRDRPGLAARGVVEVGPDFTTEYPEGDPTSTAAYATLCRVGDVLLTELEQRVEATFGVKQMTATALAVIDGAERPLTPSEIGERILLPSASITSTLDNLERRGWVRRVPNPDDRRSLLIEITDEGRATADQLLPGIRTLERRALDGLTERERAQLLKLLSKVLARAAEIEQEPIEPLSGPRNRPSRLS